MLTEEKIPYKKPYTKEKILKFFNELIEKKNNGTFDAIEAINNPLFSTYIARGSEEYKLAALKNFLEKGIIKKKLIEYEKSVEDNINMHANNLSYYKYLNYIKMLKIEDNDLWKYFGIKTEEDLIKKLNIDPVFLKERYDNAINMVESLPLNAKEIKEFVDNVENENLFINEFNIGLTIYSLLSKRGIEKDEEKRLLKEYQFLCLEEKKHNELIAENLEKEQRKKEISKNIDLLKTKKNLTLSQIYHLVNNDDVKDILKVEVASLQELAKYFKISFSKIVKKDYEDKKIFFTKKYGTNIHNMYIAEALNITETELKNWKNEKKLVPTEKKSFRKWGKVLFSDYFDVRYISLITDSEINDWRMEKIVLKNETLKEDLSYIKWVTKLEKEGFLYKGDKFYSKIELNINGKNINQLIVIKIPKTICKYTVYNKLLLDLKESKSLIDIIKESKKISDYIDKYCLEEKMKDELLSYLSEITKNIKIVDFSLKTITKYTEKYLEDFILKQKEIKILKELKLEEYEKSFPIARGLNREVKVIVGPTNSGKTHEALNHLMKANSGVYLAPLRLLAMEIYDKLNSAGIPCNLITGEERIFIDGAKHTSSTIEIMDMNNIVDVAIIDEYQMLSDKQRGWAWTAAMVGVPAKNVYVIGSIKHLDIAINLYKYLGENCEIIKKQRLGSLNHIEKLVKINDLKKGDALISFSRKDVLAYATLLRENGFKVSLIYGALSPEVRREQAELFSSGETDILVSTDAIGMGLNLPIKRVIFSTLNKYDGVSVRELEVEEVRQIAGRAGRYGIENDGFVGMIYNEKVNNKKSVKLLKDLLSLETYQEPAVLQVAPNKWHLDFISKTLKTKNIGKILQYFMNLKYSGFFQSADLANNIRLYEYVKCKINGLELYNQYKLLCAPVDINNEQIICFYKDILSVIGSEDVYSCYFNDFYSLETAEIENKKLSVYVWLSFYYPNLDVTNIKNDRFSLSKFITIQLLKEKNYKFSNVIEPKIDYHQYDPFRG